MRTRKANTFPLALTLLGIGAVLFGSAGAARAQVVSSDQPAGYIVFPKVQVDTAGLFTGGSAVDTVVQFANTDATAGQTRALHCFWINANSCCGGPCGPLNTTFCDPSSDDPTLNCRATGQVCTAGWRATDFFFELTINQPIGFAASVVGFVPPCNDPNNPQGCVEVGGGSGAISGVPEDPFIGELKCVQVEDLTTLIPAPRNDVTGKARIYEVSATGVDVREYNAVGIQSFPANFGGQTSAQNSVLCLGTLASDTGVATANQICPQQEYAACPSTLILDHFFEGAIPFDDGDAVQTQLTLVPCTESIENTDPNAGSNLTGQASTVAQFAIYNEFEQRFSSSTRVECFRTIRLADVDTVVGPSGDAASVYSVGVQGTLTGQTRIRGVPSGVEQHGLLGVAEEVYASGFSDAFNLHHDGTRPAGAGDIVRLPALP
jgi:hypothetical protein